MVVRLGGGVLLVGYDAIRDRTAARAKARGHASSQAASSSL